MSDVGSARRARDHLKAQIGGEPWCAGIGVEREDGVGFVVRVALRKSANADADVRSRVPAEVMGVVVKVVEPDT